MKGSKQDRRDAIVAHVADAEFLIADTFTQPTRLPSSNASAAQSQHHRCGAWLRASGWSAAACMYSSGNTSPILGVRGPTAARSTTRTAAAHRGPHADDL